MRKRYLVAAAIALVVVALAVGTVVAGAGGERDKIAPTTVTDAAPHYWNDVAISARATDASGVAYIYYEFDGGVMRVARVADAPMDATVPLSMLPSDTVTPDPAATVAPHPHPLMDPTTAGAHTLTYWAQDSLGNVGPRQTVAFEVGKDTAAPKTEAAGAADGSWNRRKVLVTLSSTDAGAAGVAALVYAVDGGAQVTVPGAAPRAVIGLPADAETHTVEFAATDLAGNAEESQVLTLHFDTQAPSTKAWDAAVRKGKRATLRFQVDDPTPNGGSATVSLVIRKNNGRVVKTLARTVPVNVASKAVFTCKLPRGLYSFTVVARDMAGNGQRSGDMAVGDLRVK